MDIVTFPTALALPPQLGSGEPPLQAGQVIDAVVLALLENGTVRLGLPDGAVDVRTQVPLTAGTTVRLAVRSAGSGLQLVVLPNSSPRSGAAPASGANGSQAPAPPAMPAEGEGAGRSPAQAPVVEIALSSNATAASTSSIRAENVGEPPLASAPPPDPSAVEALGEATRLAAARQGGLAALLANIEQVVDPNGTAPPLPAAVLQAAARLLDLRVPLDASLGADDVRQALVRSGLFLEARLAPPDASPSSSSAATGISTPAGSPGSSTPAGLPGSSTPPSSPGSPTPPSSPVSPAPAGSGLPSPGAAQTLLATAGGTLDDLKAALLVFRQVVQAWAAAEGRANPAASAGMKTNRLGAFDAAASIATDRRGVGDAASRAAPVPPPPYRGAPTHAQAAVMASIPEDAEAGDIAQKLLAQTDASLARHVLLQAASLPDRACADPARVDTRGAQWTFEVPFAARQGTSIAQFEIGRDGQAVTVDGRTIWRARFSIDVEPIGPVHAQIALLGDRAAVTLWAERETSAMQLRDNAPMLTKALREAELDPGEIQCRAGSPAAPRQAAGRFLDRAS